eukprot:296041-Pelagomonas_calceolata.AAC.2
MQHRRISRHKAGFAEKNQRHKYNSLLCPPFACRREQSALQQAHHLVPVMASRSCLTLPKDGWTH